MEKKQFRYSVWYDFSLSDRRSIKTMFCKSSEEIAHALRHFKSDVEHTLTDASAEATSSEAVLDDRITVTIRTTSDQHEVDEAVVAICREQGLCAARVGSVMVPVSPQGVV